MVVAGLFKFLRVFFLWGIFGLVAAVAIQDGLIGVGVGGGTFAPENAIPAYLAFVLILFLGFYRNYRRQTPKQPRVGVTLEQTDQEKHAQYD